MQPQTTFAAGGNPFQKSINPKEKPMKTKAIPAKKSPKTPPKDDYSTNYMPSPALIERAKESGVPDHLASLGIRLSDDPLPATRAEINGKYTEFFASLPYNKRIVCPPDMASGISNALRTYIEKHKRTGKIRTIRKHPEDGLGGVWLMAMDA